VGGYIFLRLQGKPPIPERAKWLHRSCRMVLGRLGFQPRVIGQAPASGLIASNHLSYLDILFYEASVPCVFVSKIEVRRWPLLGLLAELGGTVFIDRQSAVSAAEAARRIRELLEAGVLVLVFPEGTSSDGSGVLRFYGSLLEPAVRVGAAVTAAAIGYSAGGDATEKDLCYYGDISFVPHLMDMLQLPDILATLHFGSAHLIYNDRKQAAAKTREAVVQLRLADSENPQLQGLDTKSTT